MPEVKTAKIAVSAAVYSIDKPFDYIVSAGMEDIAPGRRVLVPFGKGNKLTEGFVLSVSASDGGSIPPRLKHIAHLYSGDIALSKADIELGLWMRSRYFCTFFECAAAMLPPGIWSRSPDKYRLSISPDADRPLPVDPHLASVISALAQSEEGLTLSALEKKCGIKGLLKDLSALEREGWVSVEHQLEETDRRRIKIITPDISSMPEGRLSRTEAVDARRREALALLLDRGSMPEEELRYQTGAKPGDMTYLVTHGYAHSDMIPRYAVRGDEEAMSEPFSLSDRQKEIFDGLAEMCRSGAGCALLHGVTGSGKTAIYIELIRDVISRGRSAMMLVPEISLTPQMVRGFKGHFGDMVAVIHSGLTSAERYDEYMRIKTGRARVVVGTRSAVFAPCRDLGIIILDEEHEGSYRSETAPRYNAADVAKYRCVKSGCLLLLGSATPSVESYYNALHGKYRLFTLDSRFNDAGLPKTIVANMRETLKNGDGGSIGPVLREEMAKNLRRGEQTILFINRRGNARMAVCADCGYVPQCENCSVALTYHSANGRLMCHHCGYSIPLMTECPECGGSHIKLVGCGTQKIEEELADLFPEAKVLRMDADTTTGRRSHEELLDMFGQDKADILLGTQMVAKGLDFPNVTLVGVIDADASLNMGNYLAGEHSFSLISQVVGRAGRRDKPGRAVIQSFSPANPVIEAASRQDYNAFYNYEIEIRELIKAPPFFDICSIFLTSEDEERARQAGEAAAGAVKAAFRGSFSDIAAPVLGPAPASLARLNGKYRYVVSFKGHAGKRVRWLLSDILIWLGSQAQTRGVTAAADINALYY